MTVQINKFYELSLVTSCSNETLISEMGPNMEIGPIVIMRKNLTLGLGNLKKITKLGSCAYEPERTRGL